MVPALARTVLVTVFSIGPLFAQSIGRGDIASASHDADSLIQLPIEPLSCISEADQARINEAVRAYEQAGAQSGSTTCDRPVAKYGFYPMGGTVWRDLFINNFNDLDPGPGVLDFGCSNWTYNGHDASDVDLRGFGEQAIGVPVFSAMDGVVIDSHDGEFDMNTAAQGQPANFCVIDHGGGRIALYFHFKKNSVLVQPGDHVVAGQQLGLTGSSGNSTWPHLHFATYDGGERYEPYAGECRPGDSGWFDQIPIRREFYVRDFGFSRTNIGDGPFPPFALPRTGHFDVRDKVRQLWFLVGGIMPESAILDIRLFRPNGSLVTQSRLSLNNPSHRGGWYWANIPFSSELNRLTGTWRLEMDLQEEEVLAVPFEVLAEEDQNFNRAPEPISISFDPPDPKSDQVIFCRVGTSLTMDDLDYDIVRYEYVWMVDGVEVRRIVSAGHADAIPRTYAQPGAAVECIVTPMDEVSSGPSASAAVVVDAATFDCNANFVVDADDILLSMSADANSNGVPDECEASVLFVNEDASGRNFGTTWVDAYTDLQTALAVARNNTSGSTSQIWVASGTYRPDEECADRTQSFVLIDGIEILGGFNGTETHVSQRDASANITTLSGDLLGNDGPEFFNREDNSIHVVWASADGGDAILDGFVISGGNANMGDSDSARGGGAWIEFGSPQFRDCAFVDNTCDAYGGAIHVGAGASPHFEECRFSANFAGESAGAVQLYQCSAEFHGCTWMNNSANSNAGALRLDDATAVVTGSIFESNSVPGIAGAIESFGSELVIAESAFTHNTAQGGGGALTNASQLTVEDSVFRQNMAPAWDAGTMWLFDGVSVIANTLFDNNYSGFSGGAIQSGGDLVLKDCTFIRNRAENDGGGIRFFGGAGLFKAANCRFERNTCGNVGGAILTLAAADSAYSNCLFAHNEAAHGGALFNAEGSSADVSTCTLAYNSATILGGGLLNELGSTAILTNSIAWDNSAPSHPQIGNFGAINVSYSDVQGGFPGIANLNVDPAFKDEFNGDYRLSPASPLVDAGDASLLPPDVLDLDGDGDISEFIPSEIEGHARVLCSDVDMGAFEFGIGDGNCDRVVNLSDWSLFVDCVTGPVGDSIGAGCDAFDFHLDADVDLQDVGSFQAVFRD